MAIPHPTVQHEGRTYVAPATSVPMVPYLLPVDPRGQYAYDNIHDILKDVIGKNYHGPVAEMLAEDGHHKRLVDLGCGSGRWLREMAEEFPHVQFTGVDMVPVWEEYDYEDTPDNIELVIADIRKRTPFADNTFDVVHMRQMRLASTDFKALVDEAARMLRPGGLLLSGEWGRWTLIDTVGLAPEVYAPSYTRFANMLGDVIERNGPYATAEGIAWLIERTGHFSRKENQAFIFPVGEAQYLKRDADIGRRLAKQVVAHGRGLRYLIKRTGWTDDELDILEADMLDELSVKPDIITMFYVSAFYKASDEAQHRPW